MKKIVWKDIVKVGGLLVVIVLVSIGLYKVFRKESPKKKVSFASSPLILGNPGCDAYAQSACTQMGRAGNCPELNSQTWNDDNVKCVQCNDAEGEGCVPKDINCICNACDHAKDLLSSVGIVCPDPSPDGPHFG